MPADRPTSQRWIDDPLPAGSGGGVHPVSCLEPPRSGADRAEPCRRRVPIAAGRCHLRALGERRRRICIEAAGTPGGPLARDQANKIGQAVRSIADAETGRTLVDLFGNESLYVSITPIGLDSEFGIIVTGSRDADFPSSVEQLLLSVPANQAAVVLQQRQMQTSLRDSEARLRMLWEAAAVLMAAEDPDVMMRGLFEKVSDHIDVDSYFNYLVDERGNALRLRSFAGIRR